MKEREEDKGGGRHDQDGGPDQEHEGDGHAGTSTQVLSGTDENVTSQVAAYLAKNPAVIKDWLDEEPRVLEKVLEKMNRSNKQHQNGTSDVKSKRNRPILEDIKKECLGAGKISSSSVVGFPGKSVSRKDKKRRSFSDSAQLAGMNPDAIFNEAQKSNKLMDLILDISNQLDINVLSHKILVNVATLTDADRCSLFLVHGQKDERYLEAKLFDVTEDTSLDEAMEKASSSQLLIQYGSGVAGTVAKTGKTLNIPNAYQDDRFNRAVDQKTGYTTNSIACLPIFNHQGDVAGVAQIVNKKSGTQFTKNDIEIFEKYLTFCGVGIQNAQLFEASVLEYKKNQLLLSLAKSLFQEQSSLDRLITTIIREAKDMLKCERCTVFLLDLKMYDQVEQEAWIVKESLPPLSTSNILITNSLHSQPCQGPHRFVSGEFTDETSSQTSLKESKEENLTFQVAYEMNHVDNETIKYPCNMIEDAKRLKIAKHVATNSEVLNLENVPNWFGEEIIEEDGFKPKSMLTIPIYNGQSTVIGVAQLINKLSGQHFDESDISITEAFAIFCGIGIHNTKTYESACKLMAKQRVALDCLSYHATANDNDTVWLAREVVPPAQEFNLYSYKFNDTLFGDSTTLKIVLRMFMDFDLMNKFSIPHNVVCRWALSVKKNYRPVKYHNWRHALNVCQTMFTVLKTGKMERFMEDMEVFGLLVACLCHDLDHRGTNNSYQTKVDSPLAVLYSTATMEHHHFDQCVMILSSEGNNIFQGLSTEEYRYVMKVVEQAILSTDLASYFEKRERFVSTADDGEIDWQGEDKKKLLCGMLMTAADVSAIAKPWELQHETAKMVADEFFDQGDMEKLQLNITPMGMMDREKKDELPQMQVEFIDRICVPLYGVLSESFPWIEPLLEGALSNRARWADLRDKVEMGLTWIDHDIIEVPVEEVEAGTTEAKDLKLTVETLKCKEEGKLEVETGLVKKRSFRSMRSPVRPPVGFFNRRLSTRHKGTTNSRCSLTSSLSTEDKLEVRKEGDHGAHSPEDGPPAIIVSQDTEN